MDRKLNILYVTLGYKPAYRLGGPAISVSSVAERLVRKGHHVTVFATNSNLDQDLDVPLNQPVDVDGVSVWYFEHREFIKKYFPFLPYFAKSVGFLYSPAMRLELERLVPGMDLVHTQMPFIYPTFAAARAAIKFKKPLFYQQRGVLDPQRLKFRGLKKNIYIRLVELPIMHKAKMLIALNQDEVKGYRLSGATNPCAVIPNGIDVSLYRRKPSEEFAQSWGIPSGARVILFLGRIHPIKGVECLMEAFLDVQAAFPDTVLVMAGPDEYGLEARMKLKAGKFFLDKKILFPGMVSGDQKLDLLARADIFCLPSEAEGFSMAVLEALASATAVVLSPGCHFPEVEIAKAGVVAKATPGFLADALTNLLRQPQLIDSMKEKGYDFVREKYSWDKITDQMVDVYYEGIGQV